MLNNMKLNSALIAALAFGALQAHGGVLEQFDYSTGSLVGQNGGSGWTGPWIDGFTRAAGPWGIAAPGLSGLTLSGEAGNTAFLAADGSRVLRPLDQAYSSGTVYLSFLMQQSDNGAANPFTAVELADGANTDSLRVLSLGLLRDDDGNPTGQESDFAIRSQTAPGGGTQDVGIIAPFDTAVNLYVTRFDLDADTADVFFNPNGSTNLAGAGDVSITLAAGTQFDHLGVANFVGANATSVDEIRLDTTPPSLVPEPTSIAMMALFGALAFGYRRMK